MARASTSKGEVELVEREDYSDESDDLRRKMLALIGHNLRTFIESTDSTEYQAEFKDIIRSFEPSWSSISDQQLVYEDFTGLKVATLRAVSGFMLGAASRLTIFVPYNERFDTVEFDPAWLDRPFGHQYKLDDILTVNVFAGEEVPSTESDILTENNVLVADEEVTSTESVAVPPICDDDVATPWRSVVGKVNVKKERKNGKNLVPNSFLTRGQQVFTAMNKHFEILMNERKWPKFGWTDQHIEYFVSQLAIQDSNNFTAKACVGEREGRIFSDLVAKRHYRFSHGVGRSGDLSEGQPKAVGSSILSALTNALVLDVCKTLVSKDVEHAFVCPMATGMSIALVLSTLRNKNPTAKYVIWDRVDQKSCFKGIVAAGLTPIVIDGVLDEGEIRTNIPEVERRIDILGVSNVLCIISTTSCFAPRAVNSIDRLAILCKRKNLIHVVNNAYGLQAAECRAAIARAHTVGRVDFFVQSTDKNLMVPVGGAIIAGFDKTSVEGVAKTYAGRASSSQSLDVLMTLLSMGSKTYLKLVDERTEMFKYLKDEVAKLAARHGETLIDCPNNPISCGMTLAKVAGGAEASERSERLTKIGSMLFSRNVFGARVVSCDERKTIDGHTFDGWGAHVNNYPTPYLTAAASIGVQQSDVDIFIKKLDDCLKQSRKRSLERE